MAEWKDWIEGAQQGKEEDMTKIIQTMKPKIKQSLNQTNYQNQEDLEQHLIEKIITIVMTYDVEKTPEFWDFKDKWNKNK